MRSSSNDSWPMKPTDDLPQTQGRLSVESGSRVEDYARSGVLKAKGKHRRQISMNVASMFLQKKIQERKAHNSDGRDGTIGEDYLQ